MTLGLALAAAAGAPVLVFAASGLVGATLWALSSMRLPVATMAGPEGLSPRARTVRFAAADGMALEGSFAPPVGAHPVLIVQHGQGGNRDAALAWGRIFAAAGYGVLSFDWRAHGRSGGRWVHFGAHEQRDLVAAVAFLAGEPDGRDRPIGVYACSLGAAATAMAAPDLPPAVRGLVLDCPYGDLGRMTSYRLRGYPGLRLGARAAIDALGRLVSGTTPAAVVPEARLAGFAPRPLLVMHGARDRTIPVSEGRCLFAAYPGPKDYWETPDDGHVEARSNKTREWMQRVAGFFAAHLPGAPSAAQVLALTPEQVG